MSCNFKINRTNLIANLKLASERYNIPLNNYITFIYGNIDEKADLTDAFKTKLSEYLNVPIDKIDSQYIDLVTKFVTDEYNKEHSDIAYYTNKENSYSEIAAYGYNSVYAREFAKRISLALTLDAKREVDVLYGSVENYIENVKKNTGKTINKFEAYTEFLKSKLIKRIVKRAIDRGLATKEEINQLIKKNDIARIEELFGKEEVKDVNLLATYKEFKANRIKFVEEVFKNDGKLRKLIYERKEDKELDVQDDTESQEDEDNENQSSKEGDPVDHYIGNLTNKLGDVGHYMSNIDNNVILFFSTISKLKSVNKVNGNYQYDTDNPLGIPDTMDATQCINTIFSHANAYDVNSLIDEIKRIAEDVPGMAGLIQVHDYLKEHPDFAMRLWCNFSKTIISKLETSNISKKGFEARQSNYTVNKETVLKFDFINAFKVTSITADKGKIAENYNKVTNIIAAIKSKKNSLKIFRNQEQIYKINKEIDDLIESTIPFLTNTLKAYFNTIQEKAVECYILNSNDKLEAIDFVLKTVKELNDMATNAEKKYNELQDKIGVLSNRIYELNKRVRENSEELMHASMFPEAGINTFDIRKQIREDKQEIEKLRTERDALYKEDFIEGNFMGKITPFTNRIARFSYIKTDLNSRNVHGNISSDLINNSMITNILNTLKNPTALANFGKYKQQSRQYDFSNIMVEHKENGEIINYGLFVQDPVSKELTPTPYAHRLLREFLYSGIADVNTHDGVDYSKMSRGDYTTSAILNFLYHEKEYNDEEEVNDEGPSTFANYFMRIPSDAPKNFVIRAPRYSIRSHGNKAGLFIDGKLNRNHPVYKQFRNAFVQEMQDAANALQVIFGDKLIKGAIDPNSVNENIPTRQLYKNYHYKDKIFKKDKNGKYKLTGNVFSSDRFTITEVIKNEDGKYETIITNYGNNIIEDAFDFFYGGVNTIQVKRVGQGVEIVITPEQEEIIAQHLEQFIAKYSEQCYNRAMQYKHLFGNETFDKFKLTEFALNYHLAYINFNDIFEGDTKFYKSSQDGLKRFKEVQGSGVSYGVLNRNDDLTANSSPVEWCALNNTIFTSKTFDENGQVVETPIKITQYNRFKGVTIKNTVRTGDTIGTFKLGKKGKPAKFIEKDGELVEDKKGNYIFETIGVLSQQLINSYKNKGISDTNAKMLAANTMAGYYGTTVNDAQSYITFEEWVRRIAARGQLEEYKSIIDAILDETKPLDAKTIGKFVQVQKNFYYDQYFNANLQCFAPRQIKNAEFVLVPRLIKGTQLEEVYNMMKEAGIDQLNTEETSKAGKCNILTIWDNNGEITEQNKQDFITNAKGAAELFNYNYLYTQQETPSHLNAKNKAGIQFMKKIIDNITEEIDGKSNPLWPLKQKFQQLYVENIKSSAEDFADELNIGIDENGNFVIDENNPLDVDVFYDLLKNEMARQGLDSNALDYVTLEDDGLPTMPTFMGNFHKKLESIVQSMINNRITRQTLPGFHAAQITNIGFKPLSENVDNVSYSKELKYHPDGKSYIEIMLPKSQFNFKRTKEDGTTKSDKDLLDELEASDLDTIIGYRIPTEGKQSICVMKVVGFIDDAYDSTIVVPDDWVSQTGSDFDIDSVYGISFTTEIDKNGHIIKSVPKEVNSRDYIGYIKRKLKRKLEQKGVDTSITDNIQKFIDKYSTEAQDKFNELQSASDEVYDTMKPKLQNIIKEFNKATVKGETKKEKYVNKLKYVLSNLAKELKNNTELSKKEKTALKIYYSKLKDVFDFLSTQNEDFFEEKENAKEEAYKEVAEKLSEEAVKAGLPSYKSFVERRNRTINRNVRNNELLDTAIAILQDESSLEENLSRSNFDKIIEGRDDIQPEHIKEQRAARSPYNFFDQADYQEDAMSGATLKGASVARDTFVSVCNTVRPYIAQSKTIKVVYKKEKGYTKTKLKKIFPVVETNENGDFVVTHNTLGWTLNNRNIADLLLTPYTSQTTAHILDAIKEGAIPNVNNYTFNVYKTFPDIGCDYNLAIAFMAQPAITKIVETNNNRNSIYAEQSTSSPTKTVIVELANKLMESNNIKFTVFDKTSDIIKQIKNHYKQVLTFDFYDHTLDFDKLINRFSNDNESIENLLFDLKTVLDFEHLRSLSNTIGDFSKVLNPDKFGAKQTVFDTINTIREIDKLRHNTETIYVGEEQKSLIDAIYPRNGEESAYPTLNAFYNYSTKLSVQLATLIFDTHRTDFDKFLFSIDSFINSELDDEKYSAFRNYVLNYVYTNVSAIKSSPIISETGKLSFDTTTDRRKELSRIYGLGKGVNLFVVDENNRVKIFEVKDINHPTKEEIRQFTTLSSAQKIQYIKDNFEKKGIFEYVDVYLAGKQDIKNRHIIEYRENAVDSETIYSEFEKAFFNSNPIIKLAAIDMIKYAYAVEGFKMKKGAINKMIKNNALYLSQEEGGLGITEEASTLLADLTDITNIETTNELRVNFIRSHANSNYVNVKQIKKRKTDKVTKNNKPIWEKELIPTSQGIIFVSNDLIEKYAIGTVTEKGIYLNKFVVLVDEGVSTLYRIREIGDENISDIILTPLNTLEENEYSDMSINNENNRFNTDAWYDLVIEEYNNRIDQQYKELEELYNSNVSEEDLRNKSKEIENNRRATFNQSISALMAQADLHKYMTSTIDTSRYAKQFDINSKDTPFTSGFEKVIDAIKQRFEVENERLLVLRSPALARFIRYGGALYGSKQTIDGVTYNIMKRDSWRENKKYIEDKKPVREKNSDLQEIFTEAQREGRPVNDVFIITKDTEYSSSTDELSIESTPESMDARTYYSSTGELNAVPTANDFLFKSIKTMYFRRKSLGDKRANAALDYLRSKGINLTADEIEKYKPIITQINAEYIVNTVNDILKNLNNFEVRPYIIRNIDDLKKKNETYKIDDDEVIEAIKHDKKLQEKYLKTILDARAFVNTYGLIDQIDITAEDPETNRFLKEIKEAIGKLRSSNIISNAEVRIGNDVLAKLSDNPLMQKGVLGVFDGYHTASLFDAWINDLQETSNPLLQVVSKQVITNLNRDEMLAKRKALKFKKALKDIKDRAKAAGVNINWNHIFDEDGKFIQEYNQAFLDKLQELRDKKERAKIDIYTNPKAYYEAALEFEKWKAKNIHQEVTAGYYIQKNMLDEDMLKYHPQIYIKYKTLTRKRAEIYSHVSGGVLDQNYVKELEKIDNELNNLSSDFIFDGDTIISKYSYSDPNNPYEGEARAIYSVEAANALKNYKKEISDLDYKYWQYDTKKGFDKELETNLKVIKERERRDTNGHLLTPMSELMQDPEYVKAKKWLANNTYFRNTSEKFVKLKQAFDDLNEGKVRNKGLQHTMVAGLARHHKAYDDYGIPDARLFTDKEIEAIKQRQEIEYGVNEQNPFSDRTLISNAPIDNTIFSKDFYDQMRSNGAYNPAYIAKVKEINNILKDHYYPASRTVRTSELSQDELTRLNKLYEELDDIKKHTKGSTTNGKSIYEFIQNNVDFVYDDVRFAEEDKRAQDRAKNEDDYYKKWLVANTELVEDKDGNTKLVPNHYLYGYAVPKGYKKGEDNPYVDKKKTEALRYIRENTENVPTEYYYAKYNEMKAKGKDEFDKWFEANHVYNPYTRSIEPVRCWTRLKVLGEDNNKNYFPKYEYLERKPNTKFNSKNDKNPINDLDEISDVDEEGKGLVDFTNYKYKEDAGYSQNYNGRNPEYNNNVPQNEYEYEISKLIKDIIEEYAITQQAKDFFKKGYAPIRAKSDKEEDLTKKVLRESVKLLGWINTSTGKEDWLDDNEIDYSKDTTINMPMSTLLKSKESIDVQYKTPNKKEGETDEEYNKRYKEWYEAKNKAIKSNREIHKNLLDRNWEEVIADFIVEAGKFNSIQNNKYLLFYAKNMIDNQQVYVKNLGFNKLQKTSNRDITGSVEYATRTDENLKGQFVNWIRRLVYDQYKKPNNRYTRIANTLQSFTSAKYMMLNLSGGLANVTQGWTQILAERFAKDYFGSANWWYGVNMWNHNVGSFIYDMYKPNSSSLGNAIIKFFGVVDNESITGAPIIPDASTYISRARDITFSTLSVGEHFMQNSALFAMLQSHRIYFDEEGWKEGKPAYTYKSEGQVRNEAMDLVMKEFIKGTKYEKLYDSFIKYETSKPDYKKEYVWFRKDFTTEFANIYFTAKDIKKFNELKKQKEKELAKEFNNDEAHPTLMSQLDIDSDGYLKIKDGSFMSTKMTEYQSMHLLAGFKGRVVSVNKKIHGIYSKLGAAQLENKWGGSLVMQYHKHIYPGLMKRYRRQGYFNEERGTVEKGTTVALFDFLALPFHKKEFVKRIKADTNITDEELKTVEGVQNICKSYVEFLTHFTLYFNLLPRHEQANILRGAADFVGVAVALLGSIAIQCLGADDDKHGALYDFFINQADRLATESMSLRYFGLVGEFKKMWSSPVAAQGLITDIGKALSLVAQYIIEGDEFEPEYTTGAYKGENKFGVLLKRNMPMYHSIYMLERLAKNNKYYKLDQNMLSVIPTKPIADWITK